MKFQKDIIIPVTMVDDLKKFIYTGKSAGKGCACEREQREFRELMWRRDGRTALRQ